MNTSYHTIIGLPGSGKTTFLAALWHLLNAGEVPTKLVLDKLVGDHEHLNGIVEYWRSCEKVPRTSNAVEATVRIHVHEPNSGQRAVIAFPDLPGESFDRQVTTRRCRPEYVEGLAGGGGILLFVTANQSNDGIAIRDLAPAVGEESSIEDPAKHEEWTPEMVSRQVRLVELLQFLQQRPFSRFRRRLAVIVSAWDVIDNSLLSPEIWLGRELPLLSQFLSTNLTDFDVRVYGVSAQGGEFSGYEREHLLDIVPSERIRCQGDSNDPHDLTGPILWLMGI